MSNLKLEAGGYYYLLKAGVQEPETPLTAAAAAAARTAAGRAAAATPRREGGALGGAQGGAQGGTLGSAQGSIQGGNQERPRVCTCKACGVERDRDDFSARQWRNTQPTCRACRPAGRCADGTWSGQASVSEAEVAAVATPRATLPCSSTMGLVS